MATFGVRCTRDQVYVVVMEGTKQKPITKEERIKIVLTAPKTAKSRAEELAYLKREFMQLIDKYNPQIIALKDQENSFHKIPIQSVAQRGEVEGVLTEMCFDLKITVLKLLFSHIKTKLNFEKKAKKDQFAQVDNMFSLNIKDDNIKEAILCAWAVL